MQGLGCTSINFNNKACCRVPTIHIYTVHRSQMDLYLQGSSDLRMCGSQTDQNTTQILLFWGDHLMFYRVFGVNLMWCVTVFWAAGVCTSISACACIRTYIVYIYSFSKHYLKKICKYTKWFKAVRIFFFFFVAITGACPRTCCRIIVKKQVWYPNCPRWQHY